MLLTISLFTVFLSIIILINNWNGNKNAVYLALFIIITAIYGIAHYLVVYGQSAFWLALFYNHFTPFTLLLGPLVYFYTRGVMQDHAILSRWDWVHCLPALIHAVGILPYTILPFENKLQLAQRIIQNVDLIASINVNYWYTAATSFLLRTLLLLGYLFYSGMLVWKNYSLMRNDVSIPKKQMHLNYRWLVIFLIAVTTITSSYLALTIISIQTKPSLSLKESYPLYLLTGMAYCSVTIILLLFPNILYGIPKRSNLQWNREADSTATKRQGVVTNENEPFGGIDLLILDYLHHEKPYLNPNFSITDITLALKIPQNHINYCINEVMKTKFTNLKANFRVQHSIELLKNNLQNLHTIEAIGAQSGFKSRSTFYAAFREITGFSPSEFVEKKLLKKIPNAD